MRRNRLFIAAAVLSTSLSAVTATAAEIGIGLLGQFSGPYCWWGKE